jgi:hypothetical protein
MVPAGIAAASLSGEGLVGAASMAGRVGTMARQHGGSGTVVDLCAKGAGIVTAPFVRDSRVRAPSAVMATSAVKAVKAASAVKATAMAAAKASGRATAHNGVAPRKKEPQCVAEEMWAGKQRAERREAVLRVPAFKVAVVATVGDKALCHRPVARDAALRVVAADKIGSDSVREIATSEGGPLDAAFPLPGASGTASISPSNRP